MPVARARLAGFFFTRLERLGLPVAISTILSIS